ncbi:alpha/beta hydrolase [Nocardia abscessus]|uniref:alpha/beta hydrolase n=1 Tax=Nocardia abscessus TaxID=120957 RepID=UPI002455B003|nr:alpha/beta hydrolase [Nocardia abscessus]
MKPTRVTFRSGDVECVGHRYEPPGSGNRAAVVLCPGFSGTQDTPALIAAAEAFAAAGYLAMTFDYRNFGVSEGEPRQLVDISGQIADIRAAITCALAQPDVDPERLVLWGTSLGGGHVVTVAAEDSRVAAVVAQVPFNGFPRKVEGRSAKDTLSVLLAMARDRLRGALGRRPYYIPAVGGAGELAVMASPQAQQTIAAMESDTWSNRVAPRALFDMMRYKPSDHAPELRVPLLISLAEHDAETAGPQTAELAASAPHSEVLSYPCSHFEIYRPDVREKVIADQTAFLDRTLARD